MTMFQVIEGYSNDNLEVSIKNNQEYVTYFQSSQDSNGMYVLSKMPNRSN